MPENDLTSTIADAAAQPKAVKGDEAEVQGRDLKELIEADRYLKSNGSARGRKLGIKFTKIVPPGTC